MKRLMAVLLAIALLAGIPAPAEEEGPPTEAGAAAQAAEDRSDV